MSDTPDRRDDLPPKTADAARTGDREVIERALLERVKELDCLYGITRLAQQGNLPQDDLLRETAELVRVSWQYPEIACAAVTLDGQRYATSGYRRAGARQSSPIRIQGETAGEVEVRYLEPRPECGEGPFLQEERRLIDAVADLIGRIVERRRVEEQMRALSRELIKAQENERQRIARELHDHLAQDLSLVKTGLERIWTAQPPAENHSAQAAEITERLGAAIAAIRDLAYGLLPPGLTELGLVDTVLRHCEEFSQRHGIAVDVFADGLEGVGMDFDTQINVYRLIQEALSNTRKHAAASAVRIRLLASYPNLILRIEDDGRGADLEKCLAKAGREKRMGLWSMRERARLLGGKINFRTKPGAGMRILVEVPGLRRTRGGQKTHSDR
ncbi:sensor histidine kinase [Desulfovibrio aminophilus]|nr:sensor histidine kinase [Desulfovibrio aminophilus]MCM0756806.1 sensor histidine kinase [Desulfovibrio aminophilus]